MVVVVGELIFMEGTDRVCLFSFPRLPRYSDTYDNGIWKVRSIRRQSASDITTIISNFVRRSFPLKTRSSDRLLFKEGL